MSKRGTLNEFNVAKDDTWYPYQYMFNSFCKNFAGLFDNLVIIEIIFEIIYKVFFIVRNTAAFQDLNDIYRRNSIFIAT